MTGPHESDPELQSGLDPLHHTDANAVLGRDLMDAVLALLKWKDWRADPLTCMCDPRVRFRG